MCKWSTEHDQGALFEMLQQLPLLACIFIIPGVSKIVFLFLVAINTKFIHHFSFFSMFI